MDKERTTPKKQAGRRYDIPSVDGGEKLNLITFTDEEEKAFSELKNELDALVDEIESQSRVINNLSVDFIEEAMDKMLLESSEKSAGIDTKKVIAFLNEIIERNMRVYEANERIRKIFET